MQIHKNEITTGILVLVTFGVLLAILVVIGMPGLIRPLNTYRIYYDNADGIRPGAPVRVPEISEMVADNVKRLTGPSSDLALTIKNAKTFMETLNSSKVPQVIDNANQLTDTLKREPWRLLWPATKSYAGDEKALPSKKKDLPSRSSEDKASNATK